ncbi:ATP F0F1 synthase synthase [Paenibacillus polymyxa]|nr:ATP F0F1 synthase synthase [Paenibacillus polymyxa]
MNNIIGKVRTPGRGVTFKILISGQKVFDINTEEESYVSYSPDHNLDEECWFGIEDFSNKEFCLDILKNDIDSTNFNILLRKEIDKLDYIISYQDSKEFYFQRIPKNQLLGRKLISLGAEFKFIEESKHLVINKIPDAIYLKDRDILLFKKLSAITSIFNGIDSLYREATNDEVNEFLSNDFLDINADFTQEKVKVPNRKRIALAIDQLNSFEEEQKKIVFATIKEYYPKLVSENEKFLVNNEEDLKLLLFGIGQRFYTTPDGKEKRIANSVIKIQ